MSDIVNETLHDMNLSSDALQRYSDQVQKTIPELHGEEQINMGNNGTINIQDLTPQDQINYMRQLAFDNQQNNSETNTEELSSMDETVKEEPKEQIKESYISPPNKSIYLDSTLLKLTLCVIIICFILINPAFILSFNRIVSQILINYIKIGFTTNIANILRSILGGLLFYIIYIFILGPMG